jgi:hypothetical protein
MTATKDMAIIASAIPVKNRLSTGSSLVVVNRGQQGQCKFRS